MPKYEMDKLLKDENLAIQYYLAKETPLPPNYTSKDNKKHEVLWRALVYSKGRKEYLYTASKDGTTHFETKEDALKVAKAAYKKELRKEKLMEGKAYVLSLSRVIRRTIKKVSSTNAQNK